MGYLHSVKVRPTKYLIITRGSEGKSCLADTPHVTEVFIARNSMNQKHMLPEAMGKAEHYFWSGPEKDAHPEADQEEISHRAKRKDILPSNWPSVF